MSHVNRDTLLDYKFDLLEESEKTEIALHLENCDSCRNLLIEISEQFNQLNVIKEDTAEISPELMTVVREMAEEVALSKVAAPRSFVLWHWLTVAACLSVAAYFVFTSSKTKSPVNLANHDVNGVSANHDDLKSSEVSPASKDSLAKRRSKNVTARSPEFESRIMKAESAKRMESKSSSVAFDDKQPYFEPGSNIELNVLPRRDKVQLTIYNTADITLVRERRKLTLKRGWNWLQYTWKNTLIDPTSLELKPIGADGKVEVVQLVFPPRMKNIGRWLIKSEIGGQVECEITYFTSGIYWHAFYECTLTADETAMEFKPYVRIDNDSGEEYADAQTRLVVGRINLCSKIRTLAKREFAYDAPIRIYDDDYYFTVGGKENSRYFRRFDVYGGRGATGATRIIKHKLGEYTLYTIEGRETIPNQWGKRLRAAKPATVPIKNLYKYDEERWKSAIIRFISFKNDRKHKLGNTPIPMGKVMVYGIGREEKSNAGASKDLTYVGATLTQYVPITAKVELNLGTTDKVLVTPKLMNKKTENYTFDKSGDIVGWDETQEWAITVVNTRIVPIKLEITRNFNSNYWTLTHNAVATYVKHDLRHGRFVLTLRPREKKKIIYVLTKRYGKNKK